MSRRSRGRCKMRFVVQGGAVRHDQSYWHHFQHNDMHAAERRLNHAKGPLIFCEGAYMRSVFGRKFEAIRGEYFNGY